MEKENKKTGLKILAIQMSSIIGNNGGDKWENFSNVAGMIEKNIKKGTDIIVLPEVWTVGWKPSEFKNIAEDLDSSETIEFLSEIAQRYKVNIIGGSFITKVKREKPLNPSLSTSITETDSQTSQKPQLFNLSKQPFTYFNTCPVINRNGELVATYNKMHLFSYYGCDEGKYIEAGKNPVMVQFCSKSGEIASMEGCSENKQSKSSNDVTGIKIGLSICYDIRFPEIYRAYRKAGADLLINMAAWPKSRAVHWEALSKARAIENQCFMVALTQSGFIQDNEDGVEWNLGHSRIIDYNGEVISEIKSNTGEGEGAMFAEIKFEEMYEFRNKCTVLLDICDNYDVK